MYCDSVSIWLSVRIYVRFVFLSVLLCGSGSRERHGNSNHGNTGDVYKSREQSGNTMVMGFRIIGNTAGIKLITATDMATDEALPNITA